MNYEGINLNVHEDQIFYLHFDLLCKFSFPREPERPSNLRKLLYIIIICLYIFVCYRTLSFETKEVFGRSWSFEVFLGAMLGIHRALREPCPIVLMTILISSSFSARYLVSKCISNKAPGII